MNDETTVDSAPNPAEPHRLAIEFAAELLELPSEESRLRRLRELILTRPASTVCYLLDAARSSLRFDALRSAILAIYAIVAAQEIDPDLLPAGVRESLLVAAFSQLADAHRRLGDFALAERTFARAAAYLARMDSDDLEARVLYLGLLAELRFDQGRNEEAQDLAAQAEILAENRPPCPSLPLGFGTYMRDAGE